MTRYARFESPLGPVIAIADDLPDDLRGVWLDRPDVAALLGHERELQLLGAGGDPAKSSRRLARIAARFCDHPSPGH